MQGRQVKRRTWVFIYCVAPPVASYQHDHCQELGHNHYYHTRPGSAEMRPLWVRKVRLDAQGRPEVGAMVGACAHAMVREGKVPCQFMIAQPSLASLVDVDETYTKELGVFGSMASLGGKGSLEGAMREVAQRFPLAQLSSAFLGNGVAEVAAAAEPKAGATTVKRTKLKSKKQSAQD